VKAYPNPTNGILHLEYDFSSPHSLTLYDVLGRKVANWENEYQIDISDFEKGVYFLHIQNIANQKFAVKKITLE
ncbi:MAG: T9SS type A sorting domain-containing protein, partial [Chitinophagales bacterium]